MIDVAYLKNNISPAFFDLHECISEEKFTHYRLCGGRGSTKSSFISIEIIYGIMKNPDANAVVIRKIGAYLRDSVLAQLEWAADTLGVGDLWQVKQNPMEMVYTETGQKILFRGADEPKKLKSTKVSRGYIRYIWYEELDEFNGPEEIRSINQSLMRGGIKFEVFYSYNPPKSIKSWVNIEKLPPDTLVHHSTYLEVPPEWIGEQFITEAEHIKKVQPEIYEHEYLGKVTGTGGEVFTNLTERKITDEEIRSFEEIRRGIDFGYAADPFVYIICHFDSKRKRLYIFGEVYAAGLSNAKAIKIINGLGNYRQTIVCDSAEPKSIREFREAGLPVTGARKGPDSIEYGIKFLQSLEEIIIDSERCPNAYREFAQYEIEKDRFGNNRAEYPDKNNHTIDAVRYALEQDTAFKKAKIIKRSTLWS